MEFICLKLHFDLALEVFVPRSVIASGTRLKMRALPLIEVAHQIYWGKGTGRSSTDLYFFISHLNAMS